MNIAQIEKNLSDLVVNTSSDSFIYDLLLAYGIAKSTISLIKTGNRNLSKNKNEVVLKKKLFFKMAEKKRRYTRPN